MDIRNIVWKNQFGHKMVGICPLCNQTHMKLDENEWKMGRIISQIDDGPLIVMNLRPICAGCNKMVFTDSLYSWARLFNAMERLKIFLETHTS